jgi:hypothetical protein
MDVLRLLCKYLDQDCKTLENDSFVQDIKLGTPLRSAT